MTQLSTIDEQRFRKALEWRYEVLEALGAGASACVYRVADRANDGEIRAAKLTSLVASEDGADGVDALCAEFRLASRFVHPNLVQYFDLDLLPDRGIAVTTMAFVEGTPLRQALMNSGADVKCRAIIEVLRGLQFLHDSGFVHADVKPSNVLCRFANGVPSLKLLDYHLTFRPVKGVHMFPRGTLRYMAPEVIAGNVPDARSDLYSVGVLFYEALTGLALFSGPPREVAAQHLAAPVAAISLDNSAVEANLVLVLHRLLTKRPEGRYASSAEAIRAIAEAVGLKEPAETAESLLGRIRSGPLVGREGELAEFREFLGQPLASHSRVKIFLLQGRTGSGKTRLLRECEVWAQALGFKTFRLPSGNGGHDFLHKMERYLGIEAEGEGVSGEDSRGREARRGSAGSSPMFMESVRIQHSPQSPQLLHRLDRVAEALVEICRERKIAFFVDDVGLMASDGLDSLSFIMRAMARAPAVFCCSVEETTVPEPRVQSWRHVWQREGLIRKVEVHDLAPAAKRDLVSSILPAAAPATLVDVVTENCSGSPHMITAALAHLVTTERIAFDAGGRVVVAEDIQSAAPESIRRLCTRLLESADETKRRALELLAVAGGETELATLAQAAELEPNVLGEMLGKGATAETISFRATPTGPLVRFQHRSFTAALLDILPSERVKSLHDHFAKALEWRSDAGDPRTAMRIARHRMRGVLPGAAVTLAIQAAQRGYEANFHEEALRLIRLALRHAQGDDGQTYSKWQGA